MVVVVVVVLMLLLLRAYADPVAAAEAAACCCCCSAAAGRSPAMTLCELVGRVSELGLCGAVSSRGAVSVLVHVMLLLLLLLLLLDMVAREAGRCSTKQSS